MTSRAGTNALCTRATRACLVHRRAHFGDNLQPSRPLVSCACASVRSDTLEPTRWCRKAEDLAGVLRRCRYCAARAPPFQQSAQLWLHFPQLGFEQQSSNSTALSCFSVLLPFALRPCRPCLVLCRIPLPHPFVMLPTSTESALWERAPTLASKKLMTSLHMTAQLAHVCELFPVLHF